MIRYQWIKFKLDAHFESEDFDPEIWHLVEIDEGYPYVALFGVEYEMPISEISEFGLIVEDPNKLEAQSDGFK